MFISNGMNRKTTTGQTGEEIACQSLKQKGYKIIERNLRKKWGELDIIAIAPDRTLVFVEVKTMKEFNKGIKPEDQMTKSKIHKFKKTAMGYANKYPELIKESKGWRLDLITIILTNDHKNDIINYYENIS